CGRLSLCAGKHPHPSPLRGRVRVGVEGLPNCFFWHGSKPKKRPLQFRSRDFQSRLLGRDWKSRLRPKNCKDDLAYNESARVNELVYPDATAFIGQMVTAVIDRPALSTHPNGTIVYPINYGYLPGVPAPDGDELDVYVLNIGEPLAHFTGLCIAVIHRLNDNDDKLVLVPPGQTAT